MAIKVECVRPYPGKKEYKPGETIENVRACIDVFPSDTEMKGLKPKAFGNYGYFVDGKITFADRHLFVISVIAEAVPATIIPTPYGPRKTKAKPAEISHILVNYDRINRSLGMKVVLNHDEEDYLCRLIPPQES